MFSHHARCVRPPHLAAWGLGLFVVPLLLVACGEEEPQPGAGPGAGLPGATSVAIYGPAAESDLVPFPSDRYARIDASTATGVRVDIGDHNTGDEQLAGYAGAVAQLNDMDGFSTTGGVSLRFTERLDLRGIVLDSTMEPPATDPPNGPASYAEPGAPFYLVNVDADSAEYGEPVGIVPWAFSQEADDYADAEHSIIAQPAAPLRPGTEYAFVVTTALTAYDGSPVGRSQTSHDLITGAASGDYAQRVGSALDVIESSVGATRDDVVLATVFTTATVHAGIIEMAKARRAAASPSPGATWDEVNAPSETDARARFRNTYTAPEFRGATSGKWEFDESGAPLVQSVVELETFLAFSNSEKSGPRPVVIYGHGLGGDKEGNWGASERLTTLHENGVAVFSIDSPEHGSRTDGDTDLISSVYGFFGIQDGSSEFDVGRARDNFRQMASDQLELVRFIKSLGELDLLPAGAPDGVPDLDVSRILYIGHSFGSVQGATILAVAPEVTHATWNVGGAGLMMLLRDSGTFSIMVNGLAPPGTPFGATARFMSVLQGIVDPGDPLNYARYVLQEPLDGVTDWAPRDVLLQAVVRDSIVPNSTSDALARATGLELLDEHQPVAGLAPKGVALSSNTPSGATGVLAQFEYVDDGEGKLERIDHGGLYFTVEAVTQYAEFFRSGLEDGHGIVNITAPHR